MNLLFHITEALVVTLREGIEAALVIAVLLAYLRKTGKVTLNRSVYLGLGAALAASILAAIAVRRYGIDPENELLEGILMFVAALLVGSLAAWMWHAGRNLRQRMEDQLDSLVASSGTGHSRAALGIFVFSFLMVFREGVETVLFLAALSGTVGSNPLYNALGGSLGLLLAAGFGFLFIRGSLRVNLRRFFGITGVVLMILVAKLMASGFHEFFEVGLIPSSPFWLRVIGFFTRESSSVIILILLIALPGLALAWEGWRMAPVEMEPNATGAERRKHLAGFQRNRRWTLSAGAGALALSLILGSFAAVQATRGYDPEPTRVTAVNGAIALAFPQDDKIHKHMVDVDGVPVRFFLLRRKDGTLASAFDVCYICPPKGYMQDGDQLICRNCDAPINVDTVGLTGGCNPIPLKVETTGSQVQIALADLATAKDRFAGK